MTAGERFKNWIDGLAEVWKDRLRGWMASWAEKGLQSFFEAREPEIIDLTRETLTKLKEAPDIPPELSKMIDKALTTGDIGSVIFGWMATIIGILPQMLGLGAPLGRHWEYDQDRVVKSFRLDPLQVISAWRRDKPAYEKLFDDLKDLGWNEERLEVLKELAKIIPPLPDMVRFADFSAFDPEVIKQWRQFYDAPSWILDPFALLGVTNEEPRDWANKYWFSHWVQPGRFELGEIYRRGLLGTPLLGQEEIGGPAGEGEAERLVKLAYRTMGYSAFYQEKLLQLVREVPTRVDVRRWWDMRTIDETELRSIYQRRGYFGKDLENYVIWTKVYVAFPDLMARWTRGWITLDEVKAELTGLGMPAERVEELIQTKIKTAGPERIEKERDITKTDIYKGVKQGVITRGESVELLMDLGFDEDEAVYLLKINIPPDEEDVVVRQRELTKADILRGLKTEVISRDEARTKLSELRYSPADVEFLLKIFDAQVKPPVEPAGREASKADIISAVKKGLITPEDAYLMLQDIDFTPEASEFILAVKAEVSPFSPINFAEFKDLTQKYRLAAGMEAKPVPEEIKKAAEEVVKLTGEVEALERSITEEKRGLIAEEPIPEAATKRLKTLQVKRNRAESKLSAAKSEYDRLVAEWKHGLP